MNRRNEVKDEVVNTYPNRVNKMLWLYDRLDTSYLDDLTTEKVVNLLIDVMKVYKRRK